MVQGGGGGGGGQGCIKPALGFSLHLNLLKLFSVDGSPVLKSSR